MAKGINLEPNPKRSSDKFNRLRPRKKNTTVNKHCTTWTHIQKPSTSRGRLGTQC